MVWFVWLGEETWLFVDIVWPVVVLKPLLVDAVKWCLGAGIGPGAWKWLFGVDGLEFVGVKQVADADSLCWTIFWQAAQNKKKDNKQI